MENEDCLIIGYDVSENKDHTSLIIARPMQNTRGMLILNEFIDQEAEKIYKKLIGKEN